MFFEEAKALSVTMKMRKMSQNEMAKSLGVSQSYVANKLRLLSIDEKMRQQITENRLTERHARALLRIKSDIDRQMVLNRICEEKLSVAKTESLVDLVHLLEAPTSCSVGDNLRLIYDFEEKTREHLKNLKSLGIHSLIKTSHENGKLFINICVDENSQF